MSSFKIEEEILRLKPNEEKAYYYLYADYGFELGFGRAGKYSGHSHLFFCDILFSLKPISTNDASGKAISGNLIIIPPKTYLGEVITNNFFFLKFCPTNHEISFPEKVNEIKNEGCISSFSKKANLVIPWFKNNLANKSLVSIILDSQKLKLEIGEANFLII